MPAVPSIPGSLHTNSHNSATHARGNGMFPGACVVLSGYAGRGQKLPPLFVLAGSVRLRAVNPAGRDAYIPPQVLHLRTGYCAGRMVIV